MKSVQFSLLKKTQLTHDVFELVYIYKTPEVSQILPGQYVMFQLSPGLNRSYSIASFDAIGFTLIIKRIPDGKGSPIICDAPLGTLFSGIMPLGHFFLQKNNKSKCFIGTGTGFAPLYAEIMGCLEAKVVPEALAFIFGVREFRDVFYEKKLDYIQNQFHNFRYAIYLSRENLKEYTQGYVTDWICEKNIVNYEEFYLCGSPAMVKDSRKKLEELGIEKENIFFEQY